MKRDQVPDNYKWRLSDMIADDAAFETLFAATLDRLALLPPYAGRLGERDAALECLRLGADIDRNVELLYVYAHMRMHEDMAVSAAVGFANRTEMLVSKSATAQAFVSSELGALPGSVLDAYIADPEFAEFDFMLAEIKRQKAHILSDKEERLLAMGSEALRTPDNVAGMLMNADLKFKPVTKNGKKRALTNESYGEMLSDPDRTVRKAAFNNLYDGYIAHINTLAANYTGCVKADNFAALARGYNDSLEHALFGEGVPTAVYTNLIDAVTRNLAPMHRYIALRKKLLGLDELHMYDLHTPAVKGAELKLSYEQACDVVKKAMSPMGEEYVGLLNRAMTEGWIDVMPNDGKRGGAYSWGAYGAHPYVLLNYAPTTSDIFTLAHELGHCLHSYYSNTTQPYAKAGYRIFVAEVASTCNETLLEDYLMKSVDDPGVKKYLLSYRLDRFRTTLYRQAMFAEFEYAAHMMDLEGKPLTVDALNTLYYDLNKKYYGDAVVHDDKIAYEWSRIPHFYNAFYVYKYSTGITAATSIAHNVLTRPDYVETYKQKFLKAGGHKSPYDILCDAEVDLATDAPYAAAFKFFSDALDELEKL